MSVLHARIVRHGGQGTAAQAAGENHPYGTGQTIMVNPAWAVHYDGTVGYYQTLYPSMVASADPNHVPIATMSAGGFGTTVPAGQP